MNITPIITALIGLIGAIITTAVVPYIKSKTTENEQKIISTVARTAVYAAQQMLASNTEKKTYAVNYVGEMLAQKNMKLSLNEISTAVEAALKQIKTEVSEFDGMW